VIQQPPRESPAIRKVGPPVAVAIVVIGLVAAIVWSPGRSRTGAPAVSPIAAVVLPEPAGTTAGSVRVDAIGDGALYAGSRHGRVYAFDAATGRERWSAAAPQEVVAACGIVDDLLLVRSIGMPLGGTQGTTFLGFDALTGVLRWSLAGGDDAMEVGIAGDLLIAQTGGSLLPPGTTPEAPDALGLFAIDARTGTVRWSAPWVFHALLGSPDATTIYASISGSGGSYDLAALNAIDGTERWRAPIGAPFGFFIKATDAERVYLTAADPEAAGADEGAALWAVDRATGQMVWHLPLDGFHSSGHVFSPEGDLIILALYDVEQHHSSLSGVDVATGTVRWQTRLSGWLHHGPILAGQTVVIGNAESGFFSDPAAVFGVDPATGETRWKKEVDEDWTGAQAAAGRIVFAVARSPAVDRLLALDRDTGDLRWELEFAGMTDVEAVSGEIVYVGGGSVRDAGAASSSGTEANELIAVDATSGRVFWRVTAEAFVPSPEDAWSFPASDSPPESAGSWDDLSAQPF
jgi:outer membrane protein assembly factor BamB